uniref:hypothetical protein n=1 Tax=Aliarcobacter sp. TaxID=2321116 RepID=UPI004047926C
MEDVGTGLLDECKSLLNNINSTVNNLKTTIEDIGVMHQDTQTWLQDTLKKELDEKLDEIANLIIKSNANQKVVIDSIDNQTTYLGKGIKTVSDIAIENNKFLQENQTSNSVLPSSVLQSLANCEAILKSINRVYLGGG